MLDESLAARKTEIIQCGHDGFPQTVSIPSLIRQPSPELFLHEWLAPYGFNAAQTSQAFARIHGESGREFHSSTHTLVIDREKLILVPLKATMKTMKIPETGRYRYDEKTCFDVTVTNEVSISKASDTVTLDADTVRFPLTVRPVETGDRFCPYGMEGHRLVSDFLTDSKLLLIDKRRQLVVTDGDGQIIWLVGLRSDHRYRVTEQTATILRIVWLLEK